MSKLNAGEVTISLNDEEFVLKPTLRAITTINRQFNGLGNVVDALRLANFDAAVAVIRVGANLDDRRARGLDEKLYAEMGRGETAFGDVLVSLINYVSILQRGGRPLPSEPETEEAAAEGN